MILPCAYQIDTVFVSTTDTDITEIATTTQQLSVPLGDNPSRPGQGYGLNRQTY